MYATYTYRAGSTAANILADVIKLLTGTTDKATLSGDCVQASTEILTTVSVAGWAVYDAVAGANHQVLRAPWDINNGSGYNYIGIDVNTAGYIFLRAFESWNSGAHTATNEITEGTVASNQQRLNVTSGGSLYISSQAGHSCLILSYQSAIYGNSSYGSYTAVFERTRRSAWDTNANAYPVLIWSKDPTSTGLSVTYTPRIVSSTGADTTNVATTGLTTPLGAGATNTTTLPDSNKTPKHLFISISFCNMTHGFFGGDVSSLSDVWLTTNSYGSMFDEVADNGNTYIIWARAGGTRIAIRKG